VAVAMADSKSQFSFKRKGWESSCIPKSFGKDMREATKLVYTSLTHSRSLSARLRSLKLCSLRLLKNLSDNKLFFFPLALLELTKLQTLELRNNAITFLPDTLPR